MERRNWVLLGIAAVTTGGVIMLAALGFERPDPSESLVARVSESPDARVSDSPAAPTGLASLVGYDLAWGEDDVLANYGIEGLAAAHDFWRSESLNFVGPDFPGFEPGACRNLYLATILLSPSDAQTTSDDLMAVIDEEAQRARFTYKSMRAREFASADEADAFLEALPGLVEPCAKGFSAGPYFVPGAESPAVGYRTLRTSTVGEIGVVVMPPDEWGKTVDVELRAGYPQLTYYFVARGNVVLVLLVRSAEWDDLEADAVAHLEGAVDYMRGVEPDPKPIVTAGPLPEPTPFGDGRNVTAGQIADLQLWLVGSEPSVAYSERKAAERRFVQASSDGECLPLLRAVNFVPESEPGSSVLLVGIRGLSVTDPAGNGSVREYQTLVGAEARVFANQQGAADFLATVANAAEGCRGGFTEGDDDRDGYELNVGSVANSAGTRTGGGDWVAVDFDNVWVWDGNSGALFHHEYRYFFRYGNAVVRLDNWVGNDLLRLSEGALALLYDQIVSHLQGADR